VLVELSRISVLPRAVREQIERERPDFADLPNDLQALVLEYADEVASDHITDAELAQTQLGAAVLAYLSWKKNEDGAADETIRGYRYDLTRLAGTHPDIAPANLTIEHLRWCRDLYPDGSKYKVTAVYKDFCTWLYEEHITDENVAGRLRYPKKRKPPITGLFSDEEKAAIVAAQTSIRDRAAVLLLLRAGIRKGELRNLTVRDVDLVHKLILVRRGKGGKARRVPIRGSVIQALEEFMLTPIPGLDREPLLDDHILYRSSSKNRYGVAQPDKPMAQSTAHNWWYGCLQRAGIVDANVTSGRKMHTTRHTYATDLGRATNWNMLAVQKNLGHSKIGTTVDVYTQFSFEDQELAVDMLPEIGEVLSARARQAGDTELADAAEKLGF
jgi:integrase